MDLSYFLAPFKFAVVWHILLEKNTLCAGKLTAWQSEISLPQSNITIDEIYSGVITVLGTVCMCIVQIANDCFSYISFHF